MSKKDISIYKSEVAAIVNVAASICAKDGVLSESEERMIYKMVCEEYKNYSFEYFDDVLNDFFSSDKQIEEYLAEIKDEKVRRFSLKVARTSASEDGLDIRENIALMRASEIWGVISSE